LFQLWAIVFVPLLTGTLKLPEGDSAPLPALMAVQHAPVP